MTTATERAARKAKRRLILWTPRRLQDARRIADTPEAGSRADLAASAYECGREQGYAEGVKAGRIEGAAALLDRLEEIAKEAYRIGVFAEAAGERNLQVNGEDLLDVILTGRVTE